MGRKETDIELSEDGVRLLRTRAQGLDEAFASPVEAAAATCGVNAQQTAAMMLALRARVDSLAREVVEDAIAVRRTLARAWVMRGTIHLVEASDCRWLVELLGPIFIDKDRRRRAQLGLDDGTLSKAFPLIAGALRGAGPLTRWELVDRLESGGLSIQQGQAAIHLISYAALEGLVLIGPERPNGESTYVLADEWLSGAPAPAQRGGFAGLARRYLEGYGPATAADFASWSGIGARRAREAWAGLEAGEVVQVSVAGRRLTALRAHLEAQGGAARRKQVRLLPAFDPYVLGYADRSLLVPTEHHGQVYHGGQTVPVVLVDGAVAGVWRYRRSGKSLALSVQGFGSFDDAEKKGIEREAGSVSGFFDASVALELR